MKRFFILIAFVALLTRLCFAQHTNIITGIVSSADNSTPLPGCSVFISNTSKGTATDTKGAFELSNISPGTYQLIISSIGYETYVLVFTGKQLPLNLKIQLTPKAIELPDITVEPFLENGWEQWGIFFSSNFIGNSNNAFYCRIRNKKAIHFRYSKKQNILTAIADEPLIIDNEAMGYTIQFELEQFTFNENTNIIQCYGYSLFEEKSSSSKKTIERWRNNRRNAYLGSIMHFMRSLYIDHLELEGFNVKQIISVVNLEKKRVRTIYKSDSMSTDTFRVDKNEIAQTNKSSNFPADSIHYYTRILQQPDSFETYSRSLSASNLVQTDNDSLKNLFFAGRLYIEYKNSKEKKFDQSIIKLLTPAPVQIQVNGNYDPPNEVFTTGHWASSEKMVNLLPYDFILTDVGSENAGPQK